MHIDIEYRSVKLKYILQQQQQPPPPQKKVNIQTKFLIVTSPKVF